MAENSKIEWCDHTFNPWIGCTEVSPACDHCYARELAKRHKWAEWGNHPRHRTSASTWLQPLKWNREAATSGIRRKVFCASLADVFDNQVPDEWLVGLLDLIFETRNLDWILLTKRPQNIRKRLEAAAEKGKGVISGAISAWLGGEAPPGNVWLGTTVENQEEADRRIPHLLSVPAAWRFLSCEPLLGPVDLTHIPTDAARKETDPDWFYDALTGNHYFVDGDHKYSGDGPDWGLIDWVICGGESGAGARPMHPDWARGLRDQCISAGVMFFFKQWGAHRIGEMDEYKTAIEWQDGGREYYGDHQDIKYADHWLSNDDKRLVIAYPSSKKAAGALLDGQAWRFFPVRLGR